ncbi:MAG TPA: glucoamylase family protein [Gemmatimonadaceae bacterium]|nr:glucoamylase family protein [Gemmatimonadaceae bacterium]
MRLPRLGRVVFAHVFAFAMTAACRPDLNEVPPSPVPFAASAEQNAFLDTVQHRTFDWFWELTNAQNGLVPDRWPTKSFSSIAAVGFGLTAYAIGVEHGWVTRQQAADRTLKTLQFFWTAPQGDASAGMTGYRGWFYHFLDMQTGQRFEHVELSTIDTGLLLGGIMFCREYFDQDNATERDIRLLADSIYRRVDWRWARDSLAGEQSLTMGWKPEPAGDVNARGFINNRWIGYNEAMILYVLGVASPTHPLEPGSWNAWTKGYVWDSFYGIPFVQFAPLFAHQYSHTWIDFRGIQDDYMRGKGIDYFENSRRATLSQRAYAMANPNQWRIYSGDVWGLTASDGPMDGKLTIDGRERQFHTYWARGAGATEVPDDGTIEPTATGGSIPFAPEITIPALMTMRQRYGDNLFGRYGFVDAFNPTLRDKSLQVPQGRIAADTAWFDTDYLGIDQGPIIAMIENYRTDFVWKLMRRSPYVVTGLCKLGFRGGWLDGKC